MADKTKENYSRKSKISFQPKGYKGHSVNTWVYRKIDLHWKGFTRGGIGKIYKEDWRGGQGVIKWAMITNPYSLRRTDKLYPRVINTECFQRLQNIFCCIYYL